MISNKKGQSFLKDYFMAFLVLMSVTVFTCFPCHFEAEAKEAEEEPGFTIIQENNWEEGPYDGRIFVGELSFVMPQYTQLFALSRKDDCLHYVSPEGATHLYIQLPSGEISPETDLKEIAETWMKEQEENGCFFFKDMETYSINGLKAYRSYSRKSAAIPCDQDSLFVEVNHKPYHFIFRTMELQSDSRHIFGWNMAVATITQTQNVSEEWLESMAEEKPLEVNGIWGFEMTARLQDIFYVPRTGNIWDQYQKTLDENPGLWNPTFQAIQTQAIGSPLIRAIQGLVGAEEDGVLGPETIKAMQRYWGTTEDGIISAPYSELVAAMQVWANEQP